jgi:Zn-dependent M28 family amino/carboxypeptidase
MQTALIIFMIAFALAAAAATWLVVRCVKMPGRSSSGPLPPMTSEELGIRSHLERHVYKLAGEIGGRSMERYHGLSAAADYIRSQLHELGYKMFDQVYVSDGHEVSNIEAQLPGGHDAEEVVVVGAHYDTWADLPGANDNASGVAAVLELARVFRESKPARTLRFLFFVNEEPPYFQTPDMGSAVYARLCKQRGDRVVAMLSLETIGYYSDKIGSQQYPLSLSLGYPDRANFIAIVGNVASRELVRRVVGAFRCSSRFASEAVAAPESIPGINWSDHWSFSREDYPSVMVTDTALYRYPHYHTAADTPDKLSYDAMARVVSGLKFVIADLAQE